VVTQVISKPLIENRVSDIRGVIASRDDGMQTVDQAVGDLVRENRVTLEKGTRHCNDCHALRRHIDGVGASGGREGFLVQT